MCDESSSLGETWDEKRKNIISSIDNSIIKKNWENRDIYKYNREII